MNAPRIRRLRADRELVERLFADHPRIRLTEAEGDPPERYRFQISVRGLAPGADAPEPRAVHGIEMFLPIDYPRRAPVCRMTTPLFHPNVDPQKICIGDHWSAGQRLVDLVVRIAQMIAFQSYNVKSPLNGEAAAWAERNIPSLPLDPADLELT